MDRGHGLGFDLPFHLRLVAFTDEASPAWWTLGDLPFHFLFLDNPTCDSPSHVFEAFWFWLSVGWIPKDLFTKAGICIFESSLRREYEDRYYGGEDGMGWMDGWIDGNDCDDEMKWCAYSLICLWEIYSIPMPDFFRLFNVASSLRYLVFVHILLAFCFYSQFMTLRAATHSPIDIVIDILAHNPSYNMYGRMLESIQNKIVGHSSTSMATLNYIFLAGWTSRNIPVMNTRTITSPNQYSTPDVSTYKASPIPSWCHSRFSIHIPSEKLNSVQYTHGYFNIDKCLLKWKNSNSRNLLIPLSSWKVAIQKLAL